MRRRWAAVAVRSGAAGVCVAVLCAALAGCAADGPAPRTSARASTTLSVPSAETTYAPVPITDTVHLPPYVDHVEWVQTAVGPSLQISPTPNGRQTGSTDGADVAWREVLALAPTAATPGMRAQFDCHWNFARVVAPDKPSWNLEPSRPVVDDQQMIATRCNPGFAEE
ncbi:MAG: DUF2599 domain-containing protein [Gordonia sp. (in: high G+C Gram-positive bacteria)]